jgi:tetratricopeptide (TPR) repeat protein
LIKAQNRRRHFFDTRARRENHVCFGENQGAKQVMAGRSAIASFIFAVAAVPLSLPVHAQAGRSSEVPGRSPAADDFEEAKQMLQKGLLDEAAAAARRGLDRSPKSVLGLNLLGVIYQQQGKDAEAIPQFVRALAIKPDSVDTLNNLATSYAAQKRTDLAEQMFRKSLRLKPEDATANYDLGLLLLERNKAKESIPYLLRVRHPDVATRLNLVRAYFSSGNKVAGLATAERLSRSFPKDTKVHFSLGVLLGSHHQYQNAIHEFELANALEPQTFDILHDLGQAYLLNGQPAPAQEKLDQALHLQPDSADTLYLRARADTDLGKDVDALELLVRARKISPKNTDIVLLMARLSMKQQFFEDAIEVLKEGVQIDPRRADLHAALGESYFTVGKVEEAVKEFKTLVSLDPAPRSYALMGMCYRHLGQYDEAKRFLEESLKGDPENLPALFHLGMIAKTQRNPLLAEKYFERAVRADPNYADALLELAGVKMDQRRYEEAIPLLRLCIQLNGGLPAAYYKLALAERSAHQLEAARRDMSVFQTLSKNPEAAPYPLQHFFDYLERRNALPAAQQSAADLHELEMEVNQHPDRPRSLYLLAEALLKVGREKDATEVLQRLEEVSGGDFRTELGIGVLLGRFRSYSAAAQYLQAALKVDPASEEAKYNLGEVYFQSANYLAALQQLLEISSPEQRDSSYLSLLGDVYGHLGRGQQAQEVLKEAVGKSPENDQCYVSLVMEQLRARSVDAAKATAQEGLARIPDSGPLHWVAGIVAVVRGDIQDGEKYLRKAVDLMPARETAYVSLGILYYEEGRIAEARQVLQQCTEMFPQGTLDMEKISATLDAASKTEKSHTKTVALSPAARQEFYELASTMADAKR